ncbi:MAG: hypothetical protein ACREMB_22295 [Candidatus Rokuibacteriota bacterium]
MARVLHLLKDPENRTALEMVALQGRDPRISLAVVLLQAAARARLAAPLPGEVYRLDDEGASPSPGIDHARLLELIFEADTVVTW